MAKTLVGILQILMKQDVTQKGPEIERALASIQGAATRLGNAPWGGAFDRQLAKLKLTAAERAAISRSFSQLARDINGKLAKADLSTWRHGVLTHLTAVRTGMDDANASAKRFQTTIGRLVRMGMITIGGVGGLYLASRAAHGGVTAASEEWCQKAEAKYSGLPEDDREKLWSQAQELANRRRLNSTLVFQMLREAALAMETTDDAIAVSDGMAQALLYLSNTLGADGAVGGIRAFNKAMDNIQNITPEEYLKSLDAYVRAQQVTGADMDPESFAQAIKYSRASGKIFSDDYLFNWLPFRIAEVGGSDAGTQLRAFADNTIGGTATEPVTEYQTQIGVRNSDGTMAFADELLQNPERWINERLVPALRKSGVDTSNNVQLAQVLNRIASNRLARDFILSAIANWDQKQRLTEHLPQTAGLSAADDIQNINPFATLDGLADSLKNLSGAAGSHVFPIIIPEMNSLADTINAVAAKVREMPSTVFGLALGGLGLGAVGIWKIGAGIMGLVTAGPSLQTAAIMLQGAATSLGGGAAASGTAAASGAAAGGLGGWLMKWGLKGVKAGGVLGALMVLLDSSPVNEGEDAALNADPEYQKMIADAQYQGELAKTRPRGPFGRGGRRKDPVFEPLAPIWPTMNPDVTSPAKPPLGYSPADEAGSVAALATAADDAKASLSRLNTTLTPTVDLTSITALIALLQQAIALQRQLGAVPSGTGMTGGVKSQVRASYSDFGVTP